jgi:hypothetical protein
MIEFDSKQEMMRIRGGLYAYVTALDRDEERREIMYDLRLSPILRQIAISVQGMTLKLLDKDFSPGNMAILKTLKGIGVQPTLRGDELAERNRQAAEVMEREDAKKGLTPLPDVSPYYQQPAPEVNPSEVDRPVSPETPSKGTVPPGYDPKNYEE